ncbi:MAG: alpha-xylosidase [Spirochaetales bacterium]|nr:alpha-xylosidase [Spirochaetales bacterium]
MRISDGKFTLAPGITYYSPDVLYEYSATQKTLTVQGLVYYMHGKRHGEELKKLAGIVIALEFSSPLENVIRVRAAHHKRRDSDEGKFPLDYELSQDIQVQETETELSMTSGKASVTISKRAWQVTFSGESGPLCSSSQHGIGMAVRENGEYSMGEKLSLSPGEYLYGMGERFSPFIRNGQHVEIWTGDYATTADKGYKNIPFFLSSNGYGILVNSTDKVEYEVATEDVEAVRFTVPGQELDYYFFYGPSLKEVLKNYTVLSGRAPIIPKWSLGLWLSTSFTTEYNEQVITEHINGIAQRDIPLTVFHFDCYWMKERHWCDFEWDAAAFPHPEQMLKNLKSRGLKICLWINPYISELSSLFDEGANNGYFLKRVNSEVYQIDWWQPGIAFVDFTNPAACRWYQDKLRKLIEMGVDTFKTDFGESVPEDAVYSNGYAGKVMHNLYTLLYNQTVFELLEETQGKGNALVFARSATACSQKYPVHWGGDCSADFTSMATELRAGLSFSLSGVPFWSHDMGGFFGKPDPAVYKRWIAFGLLSSHSRLHGDSSYRVPWNFDEESVEVLRHFTKLRHRLLPYLYSCCYVAHAQGIPVMRPMLLEFPDDPTCLYLDRQYMLGESLLVAPVFTPEGSVQYYLPPGTWTNFWTNESIQGGQWIKECVDFLTIPLWVRENTFLPMGPENDAPYRSSFEELTVFLYNLTSSAQFTLYDQGKTVIITAERHDNDITVQFSEKLDGATLCVKGLKQDTLIKGVAQTITLEIAA